MDFLVLSQMVRPGEFLFTQRTFVRLVARVRTFMTRQLVRARELPRAAVVGAGERFLPRMTA